MKKIHIGSKIKEVDKLESIIKGLRTRIAYDSNEHKQKLFKIETLLDEYSEYLPTSFTQEVINLIKQP